MSWTMTAMPMHTLSTMPGAWEAFTERQTFGFPDAAPPARPLPTVQQVLAAFAAIEAHGIAHFTVDGVEPPLPGCPDPWTCSVEGWADLGEVTLSDGILRGGSRPHLTLDTAVHDLYFRKPHGVVVLRALCQLAPLAGTLVAFDDNFDYCVAIHPGQQPADFGPAWWWA